MFHPPEPVLMDALSHGSPPNCKRLRPARQVAWRHTAQAACRACAWWPGASPQSVHPSPSIAVAPDSVDCSPFISSHLLALATRVHVMAAAAAAAAPPAAPGPAVREGDTVIWDVNGDKQALVVVDGKRCGAAPCTAAAPAGRPLRRPHSASCPASEAMHAPATPAAESSWARRSSPLRH